MDYKYIEQLVERYFEAETTLHEEQILRAFFAQDDADMPAELRLYAPLFAALDEKEELGDDFDERLLAITGQTANRQVKVTARTISIAERLRPLLKAVAVVAVVLTLSNAINQSFKPDSTWLDADDYAALPATEGEAAIAYDQTGTDSLLVSVDSLCISPAVPVE